MRRRTLAAPALVLAAVMAGSVLAGCGGPPGPRSDPAADAPVVPDYTATCAPGIDTNVPCLEVTLAAIDHARAAEGLGPLAIPADYGSLPIAAQVLDVVDQERVDRGLVPFAAATTALDATALDAARTDQAPALPRSPYSTAASQWIGGVANGLDADMQWLYEDGPGSGAPGCRSAGGSGCWADRHRVLGTYGPGTAVLGVGEAPTGDTSPGDVGGPSLAVVFAAATAVGPTSTTWAALRADLARGRLAAMTRPPTGESLTGIADPRANVPPQPDFTRICAPSGLDSSPRCLTAVLAAVNHARALEGVRPMVLPPGFGSMPVAEQIFVAVNLERVDRGLPPFVGMTTALDANAADGAAAANDPPDPGRSYLISDGEWAGGSANGLDAVYGWMYDDGVDSGNLDCTRAGQSGCWGHRHGILDDFGTLGSLVMGAAVDPTGDTNWGDRGGTSMAATLAETSTPVTSFVVRWPLGG